MKLPIKKPFAGIEISRPYLFALGDNFNKTNTEATVLIRSIKFNSDKEVTIKYILDEENKFEAFLKNNKIVSVMILNKVGNVTKTFKIHTHYYGDAYPEYIAHDAIDTPIIMVAKFQYTMQ